MSVYTGHIQKCNSSVNIEEDCRSIISGYSTSILQNSSLAPPSPSAHQRLPWDIKPKKRRARNDENLKPKKRKFVVLKTSKLRAFGLIFTLLSLAVFGIQVTVTSCFIECNWFYTLLKSLHSNYGIP